MSHTFHHVVTVLATVAFLLALVGFADAAHDAVRNHMPRTATFACAMSLVMMAMLGLTLQFL